MLKIKYGDSDYTTEIELDDEDEQELSFSVTDNGKAELLKDYLNSAKSLPADLKKQIGLWLWRRGL